MNKLQHLFWTMCFIVASIVVAGCNTIGGAGEDIQAGGEAIEDAADSTRR